MKRKKSKNLTLFDLTDDEIIELRHRRLNPKKTKIAAVEKPDHDCKLKEKGFCTVCYPQE